MGISTGRELVFDITAFGGVAIFLAVILFSAIFLPRLSLELFVAMVLCYVVVMGVRLLYFRKRPDDSEVKYWYDRVTQSSFPSMHAARATALSSVIALFFADVYVTIFAVAVVLLTAWSRVWLRRHYVSDVVVGVIVGLVISYGVHLVL